MLMLRYATVAALAVLAACGPPVEWSKPNVSLVEAQTDQTECHALARDQAFRDNFYGSAFVGRRFGPGYPWSPYGRSYSPFYHDSFMSRTQREYELQSFCLRARGYRLTPVTQ